MAAMQDNTSTTAVAEGAICIWWLGQTGFAFKTPGDEIVYVDPFLAPGETNE
jgi:L-ascorbate metabolism protein UlaG (beta-lactamase superfamily)